MSEDSSIHNHPFPTTHWSVVYRAGKTELAGELLGEFLKQYLPALKAHLIRKKGLTPDEAGDVLQGFVLDKVIRCRLLSDADHERGRFRTFLLSVLDNYLSNLQRAERAKSRSPGTPLQSLDGHQIASKKGGSVLDTFEVEWARQLVTQALGLMENECKDLGRHDIWAIFEARVVRPALGGEQPAGYSEVAAGVHFDSPSQAYNTLTTGKRMFVRALRSAIAQYAADEQAIDEELTDLKRIIFGGGA